MMASTVHPIHFGDYSGVQFERLVFAYHVRAGWTDLVWHGQSGGDQGRIIRHGQFLSIPDAVPTPRDRSEVIAVALRKAEMLPPSEIEVAILTVVRQNFGATREQVIQAVARGLGIRSTSAQVRSVIDDVMDSALTARRLTEVGGMLTNVAE